VTNVGLLRRHGGRTLDSQPYDLGFESRSHRQGENGQNVVTVVTTNALAYRSAAINKKFFVGCFRLSAFLSLVALIHGLSFLSMNQLNLRSLSVWRRDIRANDIWGNGV
jgi:hypothetical protein